MQMSESIHYPKTLREAIVCIANPDNPRRFFLEMRWPAGVTCPHCAAMRVSFLSTRRIWKCLECKKQFSAKVGTVMEDSPLGLDKWLECIWTPALTFPLRLSPRANPVRSPSKVLK